MIAAVMTTRKDSTRKIEKKIVQHFYTKHTMSMYKNLRESDPDKYPPRMGQKWTDEEVSKLLISIRKKKSIEAIAAEHGRTVGGINAERRKLAADYWFNDERPIEEIAKFTGLSPAEIDKAIKKRADKESPVEWSGKVEESTSANSLLTEVGFSVEQIETAPLSYYYKSSTPWSTEEDTQIIEKNTMDKKDIRHIGFVHRRTPGSIGSRLRQLQIINRNVEARGYDMYLSSKLYEEVIKNNRDRNMASYGELSDEFTNVGAPWLSDEIAQLIKEYNEEQQTLMEISKIHKRLPTAIARMLRKLNIVHTYEDVRGYTEYTSSDIHNKISLAKQKNREKRSTAAPIELIETRRILSSRPYSAEEEIRELKCEIIEMKKSLGELMDLVRGKKKAPLINPHLATANK